MGSGFRTFTAGEVLTASNVQNFLQNQSVMVFADSTARATNIGTANFEEGMLSYLEDSDTLEVYDGSAWGNIAPASTSGLTLINTTSFSGVSSQSFNDVFSTIYDNYRIILRTTAIDAQIFFRLRVAGADASGANYDRAQILGASGPTFNFSNSTGNTSAVFSGGGATDHTTTNAEIVSPFLAQQTLLTQNYYGDDNAMLLLGSRHTLATSYTGFTIFSTNNFTGTLSVYGYNK